MGYMKREITLLAIMAVFFGAAAADHAAWSSSEHLSNLNPENGSEITYNENETLNFEVEINLSERDAEELDFYLAILDRSGNQFYPVSGERLEVEGSKVFSTEVNQSQLNEEVNMSDELALRTEIQGAGNESELFGVQETHFSIIEKNEAEDKGLLEAFLEFLGALVFWN